MLSFLLRHKESVCCSEFDNVLLNLTEQQIIFTTFYQPKLMQVSLHLSVKQTCLDMVLTADLAVLMIH